MNIPYFLWWLCSVLRPLRGLCYARFYWVCSETRGARYVGISRLYWFEDQRGVYFTHSGPYLSYFRAAVALKRVCQHQYVEVDSSDLVSLQVCDTCGDVQSVWK